MTKRKHQRYDLEFKRQAVVLANHPDIMTQDVAQALNIHPLMLSRWKNEMREGKLMGQTQDGEITTDLVKANQRILDLEREVKQLKEENAVLKAAERLSMNSYGEEIPVCKESTEECWAKNRRAQFVIVQRGQN